MGTHLEYSWAVPEDLPEIENFLIETYGSDSIQAYPGRCRWLYFENPLGLHVSVCRANGKLVAACGHLPRQIDWDQESVLACFGIDFMVAREWRRRGIGRKFLEMRLDRFALSLSMGQSKEMGALYRDLGAIDLGPLHLGTFRRVPSMSGNLKKIMRDGIAWAHGLRAAGTSSDIEPIPCEISTAAARGARKEWVEWRYNGQIYQDYECLELRSAGQTTGFAVSRSENGVTAIVGLESSLPNRSLLLAGCAAKSPNNESSILFTGDRLLADCRRAGFMVRPYNSCLIAMTSSSHLRSLLKPGSLDLTSGAGDADLLRFPR